MTEEMLTVAQAARVAPGQPSVRTVWRWIRHGADGVRLRAVRTPGRTFVRRRDLDAFVAAVTSARDRGPHA
jgi:hypothetical protein